MVGLASLYTLLAVVSWRRSGDLLVDWGRELYTAWRISEGAVLYRDVDSLFGPVSTYVNASLFNVFGVNSGVIQAANVVFIGALCIGIGDVFRRTISIGASLLTVFLFLSVFAYGHLTAAGIYNFVTPYSHEATHGMGMCVLLVWFLVRLAEGPSLPLAAGAGLACGVAWLTKPEIAFAATCTLFAGMALLVRFERSMRPWHWTGLGVGLLLPCLWVVASFSPTLGFAPSVAISLRPFDAAFQARAWDIPFYRAVFGSDRILENLAVVLTQALLWVLAVWGTVILGRRVSRRWRSVLEIALVTLPVIFLVVLMDQIPWFELARPLPVLTGLFTAYLLRTAWRDREPGTRADRMGLACWSVLSFTLLLKVFLQARFYHFGFYLTLPATLLVAVTVTHLLPRALPASSGRLLRASALPVILVFAGNALGVSLRQFTAREYLVGPTEDPIRVFHPDVDARSRTVEATISFLEHDLEDVATLQVVPEGTLLNFWLRRPAPGPIVSLMPPEVAASGRPRTESMLKREPADLVLLSERALREYGRKDFASTSIGSSVVGWVRSRYCPIAFFEYQTPQRSDSVGRVGTNLAHPRHSIEIFRLESSGRCPPG